AGKPCTVHISGGDLGYLYMLHFASCVPNIGPFQEFKRETKIPLTEPDLLKSVAGIVKIPPSPGLGVTIDPSYLSKSRVVQL
ncbi:MAG: yitF, partial [Bacteroidetes bacterium]|nr:yitF [Bacteroidota bacterium]